MRLELNFDELLKEKEMNTHQLSVITGIRYNTVRDIVGGRSRRIDLATIEKIATALGESDPARIFRVSNNRN